MTTFYIAPASDRTNRCAAGDSDANKFDSEQEAEQAIKSIITLGGDFAIDWIVVEDPPTFEEWCSKFGIEDLEYECDWLVVSERFKSVGASAYELKEIRSAWLD